MPTLPVSGCFCSSCLTAQSLPNAAGPVHAETTKMSLEGSLNKCCKHKLTQLKALLLLALYRHWQDWAQHCNHTMSTATAHEW